MIESSTQSSYINIMELFNISEAKTKFSSLIERVVSEGEEFLISKEGKPVAKIVPYSPPQGNRRLGLFQGKIKIPKDFDEWPEDMGLALGIKTS